MAVSPPRWFGCAAHDYAGDDLRRRWDESTLSFAEGPSRDLRRGRLPRFVFRAGRIRDPGSTPGPAPSVETSLRDSGGCGATSCGRTTPGVLPPASKRALSIPFIDYARGDGLVVGPGGEVSWTPILVDDTTGWIDGFRGLWGLDTGDRFAGERAPAGPKYTRTATARQSWNDPLGFLGLDKSATAASVPAVLRDRIADPRSGSARPPAGRRGHHGGGRASRLLPRCPSATRKPRRRPARPRRNSAFA